MALRLPPRPPAERLVADYTWLAEAMARRVWIPGADADDVRQEAMLALWVAALDWEPLARVSFATFAALVIRRRLSSAIRVAQAHKRGPLNHALRLGWAPEPGQEPFDVAAPPSEQPDVVVVRRARALAVARALPRLLTRLERAGLLLPLLGYSTAEIERMTGYGPKVVDNARQRAVRKLRAALAPGDAA